MHVYRVHFLTAGQETAKQALHEIVILPALRPEVSTNKQACMILVIYFLF